MPADRGGAKWDRAARYLKIVAQLRAHPAGISATRIADLIGVSRRTVYRDLNAMDMDADLPIWNANGQWGITGDAFLPPLALTQHEALTLYLAARLLARASDERDTELINAYVKIAEILPPVLGDHLRATVDAYAGTATNPRFTSVLRALTQGLIERRIVEIEYGPGVYENGSAGGRRRIQPLAIEPSAATRALYLIAWDEDRGVQRTYKIERIASASVSPQTFSTPAGTSTARDLLRAWDVISDQPIVRITLRFAPTVAARVRETTWHPSQAIEMDADGSAIWTGRVSGTAEILSWILGWGPDVVVVEPAHLRTLVAERHAAAAAAYADGRRGRGRAREA